MVQAAHQVAEANCPDFRTNFFRLCGTTLIMTAIFRRGMPAKNMRQNVQKPEQLDAAASGNMATVQTNGHRDNAFCVPDTPCGFVVLVGVG
jgi:hypothetical protein